jgi:hypothetical protein
MSSQHPQAMKQIPTGGSMRLMVLTMPTSLSSMSASSSRRSHTATSGRVACAAVSAAARLPPPLTALRVNQAHHSSAKSNMLDGVSKACRGLPLLRSWPVPRPFLTGSTRLGTALLRQCRLPGCTCAARSSWHAAAAAGGSGPPRLHPAGPRRPRPAATPTCACATGKDWHA